MDGQSDRLTQLQGSLQPITPSDTMAEAGRKILLQDFIRMLENEAGSQVGEDIEHVHDMRVSTRRMRSALRMFEGYYKGKAVRVFRAQLKRVADALGAVRDLDVLIDDLEKYAKKTGAELAPAIALLDEERQTARKELVRVLSRGHYKRFVEHFSTFLTTPGASARSVSSEVPVPSQVRHIVPTLIYEQLGAVRAYDLVLTDAEPETLHALRIEFKRLRYLIHFFSDIFAESAQSFLKDLKAIQDHLGRMQDIQVATDRLEDLMSDLEDEAAAALTAYLDALNADEEGLTEKFAAVWKKFNSATVQRKLAGALVAL